MNESIRTHFSAKSRQNRRRNKMQSSHTHIQAQIHQATLHHSFVDTHQGIKKPLLWQIPQKSPERVLKSTQPDSQIRPNHFALSVTIVINPLQQTDSNTNLLIGTNGPVIYLTVAALTVVQRDTGLDALMPESNDTRTFITPVDTRRKSAALSSPHSYPWQWKQWLRPVGGYRCIIIATKV